MLPNPFFPRLIFPKGEQSKFINSLCEKNGLNTKGLANIIGVPPRTLSDWKREKYHISEFGLNLMCDKFHIPIPKNVDKLREDWERERFEANRKGGLAYFRMYGNPATLEGCRKGGSHTLRILREKGIIAPYKNFILPSRITTELAEFMGIMLGDGSLSKFQASIALNTIADKDYVKFVEKLGIKLFSDKPTISDKKDCHATDVRFSGIKLVEYLIRHGLRTGNKVKNQVGVPKWVFKQKQYKIACLRGLMDTDGCVAKCTHKYKSRSYVYYNPCFANRSKPLLGFVTNTLRELGLHPSVAGERIWLYNKAEVCAYFELVGSNNTRLLKFREESHSWPSARVR